MSLSQPLKSRCALTLVASVPVPGVEARPSRLSPPLSLSEAAALKVCFLRDAAAQIAEIVDAGLAEGVMLFSPVGAEASAREIAPNGFKLFPQRGATLGEILLNATEDLLNRGFTSVCLLNYESPTLPRSLVEVAIASVGRPGDRLVLCTAEGGGYSLIASRNLYPKVLERITLSSANFVAHTSACAAEIGLKIEMLPPWYRVEDPLTLRRLCEELLGPSRKLSSASRPDKPYSARFTRQYLAKLIEREGPERICPGLSQGA